jgi:hypothetical protein
VVWYVTCSHYWPLVLYNYLLPNYTICITCVCVCVGVGGGVYIIMYRKGFNPSESTSNWTRLLAGYESIFHHVMCRGHACRIADAGVVDAVLLWERRKGHNKSQCLSAHICLGQKSNTAGTLPLYPIPSHTWQKRGPYRHSSLFKLQATTCKESVWKSKGLFGEEPTAPQPATPAAADLGATPAAAGVWRPSQPTKQALKLRPSLY